MSMFDDFSVPQTLFRMKTWPCWLLQASLDAPCCVLWSLAVGARACRPLLAPLEVDFVPLLVRLELVPSMNNGGGKHGHGLDSVPILVQLSSVPLATPAQPRSSNICRLCYSDKSVIEPQRLQTLRKSVFDGFSSCAVLHA